MVIGIALDRRGSLLVELEVFWKSFPAGIYVRVSSSLRMVWQQQGRYLSVFRIKAILPPNVSNLLNSDLVQCYCAWRGSMGSAVLAILFGIQM